jgi:hypothetical protein
VKRWTRVVSGLLKLTGIGAATGALLGAAVRVMTNFLRFGLLTGVGIEGMAVLWGFFGATSGLAFGTLLVALGRAQSVDEMPLWRAGALGLVAGAVFPCLGIGLIAALGGALPSIGQTASIIGFFAGIGGLSGVGVIAVAKRAPTIEVETRDARPYLTGETTDSDSG